MKTPFDLFIEARDNQLKVVAGHRVSVLKSQDDLNKFRGEDDYQISLATIVNEYPQGIVLTRIREVLPDSVVLDKAITALVGKKEIISEPYGKRSQLLKPVQQKPVQPPEVQPQPTRQEVVSVDTNPTNNPAWEPKASAPTKSASDVTDVAEDTQG